ncbi:hypothetical protein ERO13_A01G165833v2 [Gossypium hirsutum]|nr:hypothetical protein ERO13_A01G165833v2 [Gossypium hirsutum]
MEVGVLATRSGFAWSMEKRPCHFGARLSKRGQASGQGAGGALEAHGGSCGAGEGNPRVPSKMLSFGLGLGFAKLGSEF